MAIALLVVGDEVVDGRVGDRMVGLVSEALGVQGLRLDSVAFCRDDVDAITAFVRTLAARCEDGVGPALLISTGGLGTTHDDLTRAALCRWSGRESWRSDAWYARVLARCAAMNFTPQPGMEAYALLPEGALLIENPRGMAAGFALTHDGTTVLALPGVPDEAGAMLGPALTRLEIRPGAWVRRVLSVFGAGESVVQRRLADLSLEPALRLGICAGDGVVTLSLGGESVAALDAAAEAIAQCLGEAYEVVQAPSFADALHEALVARGERLAVAESCTGGLLAHLLSGRGGASAFFTEGWVTYSNAAKVARLGVSEATLARWGAVSAECVAEMAAGARRCAGVDWAVATSGVAGPGGGSEAKPVGTLFVGVCGPGGCWQRHVYRPGLPREAFQRYAAQGAMAFLAERMGLGWVQGDGAMGRERP